MTIMCRQGAQFAEVWVDGSKYKQLSTSQESLGTQKEELEKQRKTLSKRRPISGGTGAGGRSSSPAQPGKSSFVKPSVTWSVHTIVAIGSVYFYCTV